MPGGSGTALGGLDGVVVATGETPFVPSGMSVWELSVSGGNAKAEADYAKRSSLPEDRPMGDVTYVQVILEPWQKARQWAADRTSENRWRQVIAYNLDKVDAWLEQAPATTTWLAVELGKPVAGVRSLDDWWSKTWYPSTQKPLDESIVLAGREKAAEEFVRLLDSARRVITLGGDLPPDEASAFAAAALKVAGTANAEQHISRALIVSNAESLALLVGQAVPHTLLLRDATLARDLPANAVHKLVFVSQRGRKADVEIPGLHSQVVGERLRTAGFVFEQSARLGTLAHRSLLALRRVLANNPDVLRPPWANEPDLVKRRLLLLGSWRADSPGDRRIVADFIGITYEQVQERAHLLEGGADTPFMGRVDEYWHVLAFEDAWTLLSPALTTEDFRRFQQTVIDVLVELDPSLTLDPEMRWSGTTRIERQYSTLLRRGLAETLALLGTTGAEVRGPNGMTGAQLSRITVRELLERANADRSYALWHSLGDVLDLLAEAAPEEFLDAMRGGLATTPPLHASLFVARQVSGLGLGSGSSAAYLLQALETIAWSHDYMEGAVKILATLASLDENDDRANRPLTSLIGILSSWCPNTTAHVDERLRVIKRLVSDHPDVARKVLIAQIPDGSEMQHQHPGPTFADWKHDVSVTYADLANARRAAFDLLMQQLDSVPDLVTTLIMRCDRIVHQDRMRLAERLLDLAGRMPDNADRARIYESLREKIADHRAHPETGWALANERLQTLVSACDALAPTDPVLRYAWLFRDYWVQLGDPALLGDFAKYETEVAKRRAEAIAAVLREGEGLPRVLDLAEFTRQPRLIGLALAGQPLTRDEAAVAWLETAGLPATEVAKGYLHTRLRGENAGQLLTDLVGIAGEPLTKARILLLAPDLSAAWEQMRSLESTVSEHYWREFTIEGRSGDLAVVVTAANYLVEASRPSAALDLLVLYEQTANGLDAAYFAADALEYLIASGGGDPELDRLDKRDLERLFSLLARHRADIGDDRIARIEWQFVPLLGFDPDVPSLHRAVLDDPAFFAELVSRSWRRDDLRDETCSDAEEQQNQVLVRVSNEVLQSLPACPGLDAEGTLDGAVLREWVTAARSEFQRRGRSRVGDRQIGHVLARAPHAPDGARIHETVRNLLEDQRRARRRTGDRYLQRTRHHFKRCHGRRSTGMGATQQLQRGG